MGNIPSRCSTVPRHRSGERFLKGPIPMNWLDQAALLPGRALHVALQLWFYAGIRSSAVVPFSGSRLARELGIGRATVARALAALQQRGLVEVQVRLGRKLRVTLLAAPEPQEPRRQVPVGIGGSQEWDGAMQEIGPETAL